MAGKTYVQCPRCKQSVHKDEFIGMGQKRRCLRCVEQTNNFQQNKKPRPRGNYVRRWDEKHRGKKESNGMGSDAHR
jgi:hypothetical protein